MRSQAKPRDFYAEMDAAIEAGSRLGNIDHRLAEALAAVPEQRGKGCEAANALDQLIDACINQELARRGLRPLSWEWKSQARRAFVQALNLTDVRAVCAHTLYRKGPDDLKGVWRHQYAP